MELDQELRREESTLGLHRDSGKCLGFEELARSVDVRHSKSEEEAICEPVDSRIKDADGRIGAFDSRTDDDFWMVGLSHPSRQPGDVCNAELTVAIRERDKIETSGAESGS